MIDNQPVGRIELAAINVRINTLFDRVKILEDSLEALAENSERAAARTSDLISNNYEDLISRIRNIEWDLNNR